jgi:hypothetical protein
MVPVDMNGAAVLLGVSRRFLVDVIKVHKHFEPRGAKKLFYPEHIALIREALSCQTSNCKSGKEFGMPLEPLAESAYDKALKLATANEQRSKQPSSTRGSGNVLRLVRKP